MKPLEALLLLEKITGLVKVDRQVQFEIIEAIKIINTVLMDLENTDKTAPLEKKPKHLRGTLDKK